MPYIVAGTLTLPESTKPATNVTITFRNLMTVSPLIVASESSVTTSATGTYSISLQYSVYAVEVTYYNNRPISAGQIVLNSETQTGLDLPTLLNGGEYEPATPAWILQIEAWLVEAQNSATASANSAQASQAQANASAASAAASAASAAQASQISGLDTVAGAIGLAALPLPDVWAPLSDSLRMITGYGRDVLVGSDVVARMVNFSRSGPATYWAKDDKLKSAAANEPRFEREGLLIEGQSTNLFPWSQEFIGKWGRVDGVASPDANFPNAVLLTDSAFGYVHKSVGNLNVGSPYAILAIVKGYVEGSTELKGIFANGGQDSSRVVGRYGPYTVLSFVRNAAVNTNPSVTGLTWAPGKATGVVLCALQIEALPFSSSYIPTTGAAATRTADKAWIQTAGNIAASPFTVAMEVNFRGVNSTGRYARLFTCAPTCYAFFTDIGMSGRFNTTSPVTAFSLNPRGRAVSGMVFNGATAKLFSAKKFGPASAISSLTDSDVSGDLTLGSTPTLSSADTLFGHIRDVKIWRRTLTDDQIKAVA